MVINDWIRTSYADFERRLAILDCLILDAFIVARLVFDGPPKSERYGENAIPYSIGGGYVRVKRRSIDNSWPLAQTLGTLPADYINVDVGDNAMAIRRHRVRPNMYYERAVP